MQFLGQRFCSTKPEAFNQSLNNVYSGIKTNRFPGHMTAAEINDLYDGINMLEMSGQATAIQKQKHLIKALSICMGYPYARNHWDPFI